ncbi:hypothetical protein C8R43DRAFT_1230982 [Mycena crocata]|nr:hypothetical protein C8R43DRAFT_1230982 [Mycena crocata]
MSMPSDVEPPVYHPLFADPEANTVLRSCPDGTLFRVPAFALRRTSEYFAATLPVTQPTLAEPLDEPPPAAILTYVLCLLCGLPPPSPLADFDTAEAALALAAGWSAPGATARVRDALTAPAFLDSDPLRLYVLASRAGWADEAALAARGTLTLSLYDDAHEGLLKRLRAVDLLRLFALHRRRRDALDRMLSGTDPEGVNPAAVCGRCAACGVEADNWMWRELRARIFAEMDTRALGDTVLGFAADEWREAVACWGAKCAGTGCGKALYDRDTIMSQIKQCIDRLPDVV